MCGINGIAYSDERPVDPRALRVVRDAQAHRGPDDAGEYLAPGVGLGFRRLAILDLSAAGHQPMTNEDGTVWLVFNGEVYNFQELRDDLTRRGHVFRSAADSETVVHAYEVYGTACFEKLRGMFALALWDASARRLVLARDRFGKKPLHYHLGNNALTFASELQALVRAVPKPDLDTAALALYLRTQCVPQPRTVYRGIRKLPPAHYAVWEKGCLTLTRYWSLPTERRAMTDEEAGEEFARRFREAVRLRLASDVPLGVFLSGGLDSSVITALMAQMQPEPVKTFSIGFAEQSHNELPLARLVADRYTTDHHEFVINPDVSTVLPQLLKHYGEPFADSSAVATYCVARETRKYVTVALTGDGGDENFAGYDKYALLAALARFDHIPLTLRKALVRAGTPFLQLLPAAIRRKLAVAGPLVAGDLAERYLDMMFVFGRQELAQILDPMLLDDARHAEQALLAEKLAAVPPHASLVDTVTALDLSLYLPDCLMTKADIASMAVSLEARAPFLDHHVMELTAAMPERMKVRGGIRKWLLRRQFGHLLPPMLLRAPKHGFDLPVNAWLRGGLLAYARERLTDPSFRQLPYLQHRMVDRLLAEHVRGAAHHGIKLWSLLCLAIWHQEVRP